jgi:hypothetical protein
MTSTDEIIGKDKALTGHYLRAYRVAYAHAAAAMHFPVMQASRDGSQIRTFCIR